MLNTLFPLLKPVWPKGLYLPILTVSENLKGVIDVDTVKGCHLGMKAYPHGGCYGECYANKNAKLYGYDFTRSISRKISGREHRGTLNGILNNYKSPWYRIGTAGDPCHDWQNTLVVIRAFRYQYTNKVPVIITKHWIPLEDEQLMELKRLKAVINTSVSGMDTDCEIKHRVHQMNRIKDAGIRSVTRIVTCNYGNSPWSKVCNEKQEYLMSLVPIIDNPLRVGRTNAHVLNGDILIEQRNESVGGGKIVSLNNKKAYLGTCKDCPDQCGIDSGVVSNPREKGKIQMNPEQELLYIDKVDYLYVKQVIGSGYEKEVAKLALEDGIAQRAARKNMQIHSAIIVLINDEFGGFFTFQVNDIVKEFCLLQSVIKPQYFSHELYRDMVIQVINQNTYGYPALITTDPKSKFETPALFECLGFVTYLKMSGFCYMVKGDLKDVRMKLLAHITMTNVWDSIKADWLRIKKEWKNKIEEAGIKHSIPNPMFASRDGCWQGSNGFANVVTGHSHNGNASVLDPTACEVILRFFMPKYGRRVYNPFGGGVQFGFVAGSNGYEYTASEIRQNQCDANNKICSEFPNVQWIKSNSAEYEPEGMFDLIFTCPPYYKVETYLDYDGNPPDGEINSLKSYEEFRSALWAGYEKAISHLNDNCFFVVMTGDSRDKNGAYYCSEAETELFFKERGLSIYNKITYLECEFTRLAHAKKTLNMRKFPKREQKIIVAYKGNISNIKDLYVPVGRL
jgi:hypothetical protein